MEEQQIFDFVRRVSVDESLRREVVETPEYVIAREGFSPRVASVIARLIPHLNVEQPTERAVLTWWT